jgi:hypothetical protein
MMKHRPVVDPLAERICIEDAPKQDDGCLCRIPVLDGIAGWDTLTDRVFLGGFGCWSWCGV